jgi:hypothetical protein
MLAKHSLRADEPDVAAQMSKLGRLLHAFWTEIDELAAGWFLTNGC